MPFRKPVPPLLFGPVPVREAMALGATPRQLRNPELRAPFRGIRMPSRLPGDAAGLAAAYLTKLPAGGVFSHLTAAALHGMPLPSPLIPGLPTPIIHVSAPPPARARTGRGVIGHVTTLRADELGLITGLPVTSAERTWCDLATLIDLPSLVAAGDHLLWFRHPLTTLDALAEAVRRYPSRRGIRKLRAALPLLSDRSQSAQETKLRLMIGDSRLPQPSPNLEILLPRSNRRVFLDLAFVEYRLALEYEGDHHRTDRDQWHSDIRRAEDLAQEGWVVMRLTATDLNHPDELIARIATRLTHLGWHPPAH